MPSNILAKNLKKDMDGFVAVEVMVVVRVEAESGNKDVVGAATSIIKCYKKLQQSFSEFDIRILSQICVPSIASNAATSSVL